METPQSTPKKVAVISGGFGYVGFATATKLAEEGYSVALLYKNTNEEEVKLKMSTLVEGGHGAYKCDLANELDVTNILDRIESEQGPISAAVHAAGQKPDRKKLFLTTQVELEVQLQNNVVASFNFLTQCAKKLKEHGEGVLIGVTTIGVLVPEATKSLGAYIPAKYAVQGMLTMLKDELHPYNVRVYSIAPGFMPEGMNADIPKAFVQMIEAKSGGKGLASAGVIADTVLSLTKGEKEADSFTVSIAPEYGM